MTRRTKSIGTSRRTLLKSLGAGAALGPFLPLLNASGQEMVFPKRLLLFYTPDGTSSVDHGGMLVDWKPAGTETAFTFQSIHTPLEPFKSKIVVPWGMKFSAKGAGQEHAFGMAGLWSGFTLHGPTADANFDGGNGNRTGWGGGPTIDQLVAAASGPDSPYQRAPGDSVQDTAYRTLELGAQCGDPDSKNRMIYAGDNQPLHPETNPLAAFNRLFTGVMQTPQSAQQATARKRAQLDLLMGDVARLRTRVGSEEYPKIDAHLTGLQSLANRLNGVTTTVGCTVPTTKPAASTSKYDNSATFQRDATAMMDLVTRAFACDLVRVASVQLSHGFSGIVHSWVGSTQGHHTVSHLAGDNTVELANIDRWYATQFAYLLGALDSVKEGNGTMLDNTLVVWGREMGATNHKMQPLPMFLAGSARGKLATGRFLDVKGQPHAKALVSIGRLMGLNLSSVGDIDLNSGPLAGIG